MTMGRRGFLATLLPAALLPKVVGPLRAFVEKYGTFGVVSAPVTYPLLKTNVYTTNPRVLTKQTMIYEATGISPEVVAAMERIMIDPDPRRVLQIRCG